MKTITKFTWIAILLIQLSVFQGFAQTDYMSVDDSYIHSTFPNNNYGANTSVVTKIGNDSRYAFYKFDLSSVSGNITSAIIKLNVKSVSASTTRSIYTVSDDSWSEGTLNWNNQPVIGSELANVSVTSGDDEQYVEWDITSYVQSEVNGGKIVSICVNDPGATNTGVDFYTKEQGTTKTPILTVTSASNNTPSTSISSPTNGASFTEGDNIVISANATDPDGTISKVEFYHGAIKLGEDLVAPYTFTWANVSAGNYNLNTVATDNLGATATSSIVSISVSSPSNNTPTTSITSPSNGASFPQGDNIIINANATDTDGTISKVEFFQGAIKLGEDFSAPYSYTWNNVGAGSYNLTTVATDNIGATGTSLEVSITVSAPAPPSNNTFVHPGGMFNKSDLDRMKYMVAAGIEPYATSFSEMQADPKSSYNYSVQGNTSMTQLARGGINGGQWESDATAAYLNAIMWSITGDNRHANKCVEIFNAWKNITYVDGTGTYPLNAGLFVWKMVEAAEIIRSTYNGWQPTDMQAFQDMLVYPGYSDTGVPGSVNSTSVGSFYWRIYMGDTGRHGNQDLIAYRGMITMAVFLDNRKMYDRALNYFTSSPGRTDDIPLPTGPSPSGNQIGDNQYFTTYQYLGSQGTIPDYHYNGALEHFIWENGQCQESSRDQEHAFLGLGMVAGFADVAWNQGNDVWNMLDGRILKGFEFMSRYNVSFIQSYPDQSVPWEPTAANGEFIQRNDRSGRWFSKSINPYFESNFTSLSRGNFPGKRPVYEQALAHFDVRMGVGDSAVWTKRGRDVSVSLTSYEKTGFSLDHAGWGALCFRRPQWAAGNPIAGFSNGIPNYNIHNLPFTVEAENYDFFTADGEGHTYHDLSTGNTGGAYRSDAVDIQAASEGGYALTDLDSGEWLTYTCNVSQAGTYQLDVRYAASSGAGTIKFASNGVDITPEVSMPSTGGLSTWATHTISNSLSLSPGIHVIRIYVGGTSDSFNLNSFTITFLQGNQPPSVSITSPTNGASYTESGNLTITADATDVDGTVANVEFYLGEDKIGEDSTYPYELTWNYLPIGTHVLTAKAIDNDNQMTTSTTVTITVTSGNGTLQNLDLGSTDDSYVHSANISANYGSNTSVVTKWSVADSRYAFYKFDLSAVQGAVSSATLKLKVKSISGNATRSVYKVSNDSWNESAITYSNQPQIGSELQNISITTSQNGTYVLWDVTDYVAVKNGLNGLVSFCINDVALTNIGIDFHTKESTGNAPLLSVTYSTSSNANPNTTITSPSNGASFLAGSDITISANASDSDGSINKVEFYQGTTKLGEDLTSPYSFSWSNVSAGSYTLTTVATDNLGGTDTSSGINITVGSSNSNPNTSITSPINGASFAAGDNITITADASDSDGNVSKLEFYEGATKLGEDLTSPYSFSWSNVSAGSYNLTTVATDNLGGTGISSVTNITVTSAGLALGSTYKIIAIHSSKAMEIKDSSTSNNMEAVQNPYTGSTNEHWVLEDGGSGLYKLKAVHSNKYLQIKDGKLDNGMEAVQYSSNSSGNQKWDITGVGNGNYKITNQNSNKSLGVLDGKTENGEKIVQYNYSGNSSMQWHFELISFSKRDKVKGTEESKINPIYQAYPNPTTSILKINCSININSNAKIYDLTGKLCLEAQLQNKNESIDLSPLHQGLYILEITGKDKILHRSKVIKN